MGVSLALLHPPPPITATFRNFGSKTIKIVQKLPPCMARNALG